MSIGSGVRRFLGLVWAILEGVRKVLHLLLMLVIFGFLLAALHSSIPSVPKSAALVIAPEGDLVEQLAIDPLRRAVGEASGTTASETLLKDVIEARARALASAGQVMANRGDQLGAETVDRRVERRGDQGGSPPQGVGS